MPIRKKKEIIIHVKYIKIFYYKKIKEKNKKKKQKEN